MSLPLRPTLLVGAVWKISSGSSHCGGAGSSWALPHGNLHAVTSPATLQVPEKTQELAPDRLPPCSTARLAAVLAQQVAVLPVWKKDILWDLSKSIADCTGGRPKFFSCALFSLPVEEKPIFLRTLTQGFANVQGKIIILLDLKPGFSFREFP